MATLFLDYENGNNNYGGTSFAVLASGTDGRISSTTFSSSSANFPNDGTLATAKNLFYSSERLPPEIFNFNVTRVVPTKINLEDSKYNIPLPSGLTTAFLLTEDTQTGTHDLRTVASTVPLVSGQTYTFSCYVKSNGVTNIIMNWNNTANFGARFNLSTGQIVQTGSSISATISDQTNGWYRISITAVCGATSDLLYIGLSNSSHSAVTAQSYTGDGVSGLFVSSPQVELGSSATSYEKSPIQYLSIWNGSSYVIYEILERLSSTSLKIAAITGGNGLSNQTVDRQYYIGGRWKDINTLSGIRTIAGDTVRIMASPQPTLVGSATFTSNISQAAKTISSSTNASPISITITNHGYSTGDTVAVYGHTTNTNANGVWVITSTGTNTFTLNGSTGNGVGGATGSVRQINNSVITLGSSVTANIASFGNRGQGRTSWTANTNVTATLDATDYKEGDVSDNIAVGASFTTGKAAHKATGTLDLSGYQQVSFWIKQTAGTATVDGDISLALCSDTAGNTVVNTINIPGVLLNNRWLPIVVNLGTNLGSSIQSVALYVNVDRGAQTFLLSNIIACKASSSDDSLNLTSLISKNTTNEKWWAPIQSINGTRILLDNDTNTTIASASVRGYYGTSETTNLYKRETIKTPPSTTTATGTATQIYSGDSGSFNYYNFNPDDTFSFYRIILEGGYDRTSMSVRDGETFFDGQNSQGAGLFVNARNYVNISHIGFFRYWTAFQPQNCYMCNFKNMWFAGCLQYAFHAYGAYGCFCENIYAYYNTTYGIVLNVGTCGFLLSNVFCGSNAIYGILLSYSAKNTFIGGRLENNTGDGFRSDHGIRNRIKNLSILFNSGNAIGFSASAHGNMIEGCSTTGNARSVGSGGQGDNFIYNCSLNEAIEFASAIPFTDARTILYNNDNTTNNFMQYIDYGAIYNTALVTKNNSGFSWALAPMSSLRNRFYPLSLPIAKVAVNANKLVTVKAWLRRTSVNLVLGLRVNGGQIAGVSNDISSFMTSAADTWEQVTLTFTPTENGVIEILAIAYGGTTFTGYVDDISISQL